jgi:sugar O-acyltransferase (sialic acid O-acetyltransferase NeuD family)
MGRLAIIGAGGHGHVVAEIALVSGWASVDFYDNASPIQTRLDGFSILGGYETLFERRDYYDGFHVAIGENGIRLSMLKTLREQKLKCPNIIHPSAVISASASFGDGICVMPQVVVNAFCKIGDGVILNTAATVDHDCDIGCGVHISPGAHLAGGVLVGKRTWIGIGASVINGMKIGSDTVIGAGSAVVGNIPKNVTSVGVPSKIIVRQL